MTQAATEQTKRYTCPRCKETHEYPMKGKMTGRDRVWCKACTKHADAESWKLRVYGRYWKLRKAGYSAGEAQMYSRSTQAKYDEAMAAKGAASAEQR